MNDHVNDPERHTEPPSTSGVPPQDTTPSFPEPDSAGHAHRHDAMADPATFTKGLLADAMPVPEGEWTAAQMQDELVGNPWHEQGPTKPEHAASSSEATGPQSNPMAHLLDLHLPLTIELGRTEMSVAEILDLNQGSIVELDKLAGEPVDVLINQQPVAQGEVVVIDDKFGIRITRLVKPGDRISTLSLQ